MPGRRSTPASSRATCCRCRFPRPRIRLVGALVDRRRDARHRRQVVAPVLALDVRRQRTAHREPHDDLRPFAAAKLGVLGERHPGELLGVALEQIEEPAVPLGVVEAGTLAVHLVRQPARGDDRDLKILGVAFDRAPQRLPELVEPPRARHRKLQHAHRQRNDGDRPLGLVRNQHRQRREDAVVQRPMLVERHVELVRHERMPEVGRELGMTLDRRQVARPAAFVGHVPLGPDAQRERRVVVEEERRDVVVVDHEQHVGPLLGQPVRQRREVPEDRRPDRIVLLVLVVGEADGRRMRRGDAADDACHAFLLFEAHVGLLGVAVQGDGAQRQRSGAGCVTTTRVNSNAPRYRTFLLRAAFTRPYLIPSCRARCSASTRFRTCSFPRISLMCHFTVPFVRSRWSAISWLVSPTSTSARMSTSTLRSRSGIGSHARQ